MLNLDKTIWVCNWVLIDGKLRKSVESYSIVVS